MNSRKASAMPLEAFARSASLSLGVELELQLVNPSDFDLTAASPDVLSLLARKPFPGRVVPEVTQSMIEVSTGIHQGYATLIAELRAMRDTLLEATDKLNIGLCGGGTHPFQMWADQRIFKRPRYLKASHLYGYLAKQFTVFGQHIHVGCRSGDEALYLLHALNRYVPQFIALSASSPFVQGRDTLFQSARLNSVFAFPLSGRAPFYTHWETFCADYFEKMENTGIVSSMKDFYWDIRPKPEYGTVELRVCDTPLCVERAAALACYLQALCKMLLEQPQAKPTEDDYLVYNHNRFQACRFGLDGVFIHPGHYTSIGLREDILNTLAGLQVHAGALKCEAALEDVRAMCERDGDAGVLRDAAVTSGRVQAMVQLALERFRHGQASP